MDGVTKCYNLQNLFIKCIFLPCTSKMGKSVSQGKRVSSVVQLKIPEVEAFWTLNQTLKIDISMRRWPVWWQWSWWKVSFKWFGRSVKARELDWMGPLCHFIPTKSSFTCRFTYIKRPECALESFKVCKDSPVDTLKSFNPQKERSSLVLWTSLGNPNSCSQDP